MAVLHAAFSQHHRRRKSDRSDPADVHQHDDHELCRHRQIARDSSRQTDRAERRNDLEDHLIGGEIREAQNDQRPKRDHDTGEHHHRNGLPLRRRADTTPECFAIATPPDLGDNQQRQNGNGADLDAPGRSRTAPPPTNIRKYCRAQLSRLIAPMSIELKPAVRADTEAKAADSIFAGIGIAPRVFGLAHSNRSNPIKPASSSTAVTSSVSLVCNDR